jgi:hypothetical protein
MLFGVANGGVDLIPFKRQRTLQHHLDGCTYIEKKMMRTACD